MDESPSSSSKESDIHAVQKRLKLIEKETYLGFFEWHFDQDKICFENARMSEIVGSEPKIGVVNKFQFIKCLHPEDINLFENALTLSLESGNDFSATCRIIPERGEDTRWVKFMGELKVDQNKNPSHITGIAKDITDQKNIRGEKKSSKSDILSYGAKQLRLLTDALPVLISYVDHYQYYQYANRTYREWFGLENEQISGRHLRDVLGEEAYQSILPNVKKVLSGEHVLYEQMIPYKNGGSKYVMVNYTPDKHADEVKGFYVLVQDITNRKRREANQAFLAELSEELSKLSHAGDIVRTVGKKLGSFLNTASCIFADVKEEKDECFVEYAWYKEDMGLKGTHRLSEYLDQAFLQSARRGEVIVINNTQTDSRIHKEKYATLNIQSSVSVPYLRDGKWKYLITFTSTQIREWRKDEIELLEEKANRLCLRIERARAEETIRNSEARLAAELEDTKQLQLISTQLIQQNNMNKLYEQILDASMALMDSQMASLQMLNQNTNELELLAFTGFHPDSAAFWKKVSTKSHSTCGISLRTKERIIVPNIDEFDTIVSSKDYHYLNLSSIKAVQTTPLISRSGHMVGMISTHWKEVHQPEERELRMLDVLARQAADLIEQKISEESLKEADRRKDEFLATLSHELRNPLTPIKTALELMEEESDDELKKNAIEVMGRQVGKMAHLLHDLMDISRITRGKIHLQKRRVLLSKAFEAAVETLEPSFKKDGHSFSSSIPDEPIYIYADMDRIVQIITNLLTNAAKYTPKGGRISLSALTENDNVIIKVIDNGIGISKNHLSEIFEMFNQVNQQEGGTQSGLGIGLSLSKNLIEMHNGTIRAHSEGKGKGAEFVVTLPTVKIKSNSKYDEPSKKPLNKKRISKRILVVDDNVDIADTLHSGLSREGHQLKVCYKGRDAISVSSGFHPEIAVLDIGLPDIEGYEVAKHLRKQFKDILLIALTGWGQKKDKLKSKSAGFDYHLVKPAGIKEILEIIDSQPDLVKALKR